VRRRRDLTGWILMAVLFIGAMALIFYILLLRAQHLASREQERMNPQSGPNVEQVVVAAEPIIMHAPAPGDEPIPHRLLYEASAAS
jgi:flagellar basal body-associated protein FliL